MWHAKIVTMTVAGKGLTQVREKNLRLRKVEVPKVEVPGKSKSRFSIFEKNNLMQPKKEHYRRKLPHFQQPGQWYSVTFTLKGAMPKGAMAKYASALETARTRYQLLVQEAAERESCFPKSDKKLPGFGNPESREPVQEPEFRESEFPNSDTKLAEAKKEYQINLRKYRLAYDKILNKYFFCNCSAYLK